MTLDLRSVALDVLTRLCPRELVRREARRFKVIRRQGKVNTEELLMVVGLGLVERGPVSIAQLGHLHAQCTGTSLARSSCWARFAPEFADLMKGLLDRIVADARTEPVRPPGKLSVFREVIAADSSVVKVHDGLRETWRGTRRNSANAAIKLHAWIRVFSGEVLKYRVTREAYGDSRAFGVEHDLRGKRMHFDRGHASSALWGRIDRVEGYFLCRLPRGWNPTIMEEGRRHLVRDRQLSGRKLRAAVVGLQRTDLDVVAEFDC